MLKNTPDSANLKLFDQVRGKFAFNIHTEVGCLGCIKRFIFNFDKAQPHRSKVANIVVLR
jgi:hypothetical protein